MLPLLAGAASLGGALASALPTAQSRHNNQQIKRLKQSPGLAGAEKDQMYAAQMDPARQAASQLANAYAGAAGRGPNATADLARMRGETATAIGGAARTAGDRVIQADMQRKQTDKAELEQRLAAKAQRTSDVIGGIGGAVADIAGVEGQVKGEVPLDIYDKSVENKSPLAKAGAAIAGMAKAGAKKPAPVAAAAPDVNALPEEVTDDDLAALEAGMNERTKYMPRARRGL